LFSAVISEHFSKNRVIISVVAAKYGISKMCSFYWATLYKLKQMKLTKRALKAFYDIKPEK